VGGKWGWSRTLLIRKRYLYMSDRVRQSFRFDVRLGRIRWCRSLRGRVLRVLPRPGRASLQAAASSRRRRSIGGVQFIHTRDKRFDTACCLVRVAPTTRSGGRSGPKRSGDLESSHAVAMARCSSRRLVVSSSRRPVVSSSRLHWLHARSQRDAKADQRNVASAG
jgi:hypothetical protein